MENLPVVAIDFETYYDDSLSITTLGVHAYLAHPDVEIYMVSLAIDDGREWVGDPREAPWDELPDEFIFVAHNAAFDSAVYDELRKELPDLPSPMAWRCTADLCAYLGLPRDLKGAALDQLGEKADKSVRSAAKGERWPEDFTDEEQADMLEYALNDARYCLRLWQKLNSLWPENEQRLSEMTGRMGARGVCVNYEALKEAHDKVHLASFENSHEIPWAEFSKVGLASTNQLALHCLQAGIPAPPNTKKDDSDFLDWVAEYGDDCPWVAAVGKHRSLNRLGTILNKFESYSVDGKLRYSLKYCGAHTGRWSGSGGMNMQNMSAKSLAGVNLRNLIIPCPGNEFHVSDYSAIEAVVILWLAGDERQLNLIRDGLDVYEAHARMTMGYDSPRPLKEEDPDLRKRAKVRSLGLGFGMGAGRFIATAKQSGLILTEEEAQAEVDDYRAKNRPITALWSKLGNACKRSRGQNFELELPSGRILPYWKVTESIEKWTKTLPDGTEETKVSTVYRAKTAKNRGVAKKQHGGLLTENLVQATARDILAHALPRIEDAGLPVVLHVHDEVVCEVPIGTDPELLTKIMTDVPAWASTCPVSASTHVMTKYDKAP